MVIDAKTNCSFCGKNKNEVDKLIVSESASICNECVELCQGLLTPKAKTTTTDAGSTDPHAIKDFLDKHVVGQRDAKIVLSVALAGHVKRLASPNELVKPNILMIGPSGSGKTLLVKTVARYLDLPVAIGDATGLTEAGYAGEDVESILSRLVANAKGDISKAEQGIVFIDEIDKIARRNDAVGYTRDVSGEGVQQALLKMIEGTVMRVPALQQKKSAASELLDIDTSRILFIGSGAFVDLEKTIKNRQAGSAVGFTGNPAAAVSLDTVTPQDLVNYGLIPEFVGRFANLVTLSSLNREDLLEILTRVDNNIVAQYRYLCACDNVNLQFTEDALDQIVSHSLQAKTGARFLVAEMEKIMRPHLFNLRQYWEKGIHNITIDVGLVRDPKPIIGDSSQ
jgi:ATP-dependent Clp protease ATP-binding subunit ClpX